ncbi:MAG: hypothetical protein WC840_03890 [Candidatus Peribacteraceae bacterium]
MTGGFTDDLEVPHHRIDDLVVRTELFERQARYVTLRLVDSLQNVFDA